MPQKLTRRLVDELVNAGRDTEITDLRQPGLAVRSGPKRANFVFVWSPRGKKSRLVLGSARELEIDEARSLARAAADLVAQGLVPDADWVRRKRAPSDEPVLAVRRSTWTFAEARTVYLAEVKEARRQATYDDYRKALHHSCLTVLESRPVCDITEEDVSEILARYHAEQKGKAAAGLKRRLSPFWTYMQSAGNRKESGVRRKLQIDLPLMRHVAGKKKRYPHPSDVADLYRRACENNLNPTNETANAAVMLLCLSAQRRETVVSAQIDHVFDGLWHIPPAHRKTAEIRGDDRIHVLPWPGFALEANGDPWLFPAARPRKAGNEISHMAGSTVTHTLLDAEVGFSPHDVRRSFQTTMSIHGYAEEAAALVLDHNEGPVTTAGEHYDAYRNLPAKTAMLKIWHSYVLGKKKMSDGKWYELTGQRRIGSHPS